LRRMLGLLGGRLARSLALLGGRLARRSLDPLGRDRAAPDRFFHRLGGACGAAAGAPVDLGVGRALGALLLGGERLPVRDRNLIVIGMDFAERQEPVAIAAVVDGSR